MIISRLLWTLKERDGIMCLKKEIAVPLMEEFHVSRWTLRRIWNRALENLNNFEGLDSQFLTLSLKRSNCGRNEKWNRDDVIEAGKDIPLHKRRTIQSPVAALQIPKRTLFGSMMKEGRKKGRPYLCLFCSVQNPCSHKNTSRNEYLIAVPSLTVLFLTDVIMTITIIFTLIKNGFYF